MTTRRYIRFDDAALQSAFINEVERSGVAHVLDGAGSVCFTEIDANAVIDCAHRIRDAQFRWYFLQMASDELTERFAVALAKAGLPFFVEYHDSGTWFLVRRADALDHDQLMEQVVIDSLGL